MSSTTAQAQKTELECFHEDECFCCVLDEADEWQGDTEDYAEPQLAWWDELYALKEELG